jgi:RimJ/RimL family protein N-acetyltransferase
LIVRAAPKEHYTWLTDRAGLVASSEFRAIEAVDGDGRIAGMVGYDSWTPNGVFMSVALDNPIYARTLLPHAFQYPFVEAGREVAVVLVRSDNERSRRLVQHLGFKWAYIIKDGWAKDIHLFLYEMRREDCRYIRGEA